MESKTPIRPVPRAQVGDAVELAYGQAPGYWRVVETLNDDYARVEQIPGACDGNRDDQIRRIHARHITRLVVESEVAMRQAAGAIIKRRR